MRQCKLTMWSRSHEEKAAMPIKGKNSSKSSPERTGLQPWVLVCSIMDAGSTMYVSLCSIMDADSTMYVSLVFLGGVSECTCIYFICHSFITFDYLFELIRELSNDSFEFID